MRIILIVLATSMTLFFSGCVTMEDCCECLQMADALSCNEPYQDCVDKCFDLCESTRACYCSNAREVGCEAECGCER